MRKLASIQQINNISVHPNADRLEIASIKGWNVVVKKDEFKIGDLIVYFEIDSFLPEEPRYEFLRNNSFKKTPNLGNGFRIKTIKLRQQLSQGLVLPLSLFPELDQNNISIDTDLTDILNIKKYEPPIPTHLQGLIKGNFPTHLFPKTEQERIQNIFNNPSKQIDLNQVWNIEEKLDGSSLTFYYFNGETGVCSRNLELKLEDDNNSYVSTIKQNGYLDALSSYCKMNNLNLAVQAELCGPGIQGNIYKLPKLTIFVFDIFDIDKKLYFDYAGRLNILNGINMFLPNNPIPFVPYFGSIYINNPTLEYFLDVAIGNSLINPSSPREGLVFKSAYSGILNYCTCSFKSISNAFLCQE